MHADIKLYLIKGFTLAPCKHNQKHSFLPEWQNINPTVEDYRKWFPPDTPNNVAIITGKKSDIFVLDIDNKNGAEGDFQLHLLEEEYGKLPETPQVLTPNGGMHYYFKYPEQGINNKTALRPGIDIRGDGGLIIAPPSRINGKPYEWELSSHLLDIPIAEAPKWLLNLIGDRPKPAPEIEYDEKSMIPQGQQDNVLSALVMSMAKKGIPEPHIKQMHSLMVDKCQQDPNKPFDKEKDFKRYLKGAKKKIDKEEKLTPYNVAKQIIEKYTIAYSSEKTFYKYYKGVYREIDETQITKYVTDTFGPQTENFFRQVLRYIRSEAFHHYSEFDDQNILNLRNGCYNLDKMTYSPGHSPNLLSTRQLPITYDADAKCPLFLKILHEIFENNEEYIYTLLEFFASCFTQENFEKMLFLVGEGNNGKSTLIDILSGLFDSSQIAYIQMGSLAKDTYLASLSKVYVNISSELNVTEKVADGILKDIVSGGKKTVAQKYKAPMDVVFTCKFIYGTNNFPKIDDLSYGFKRRLILLPFNVNFADGTYPRIDRKTLVNSVLEEKSGIFNLMMWCLKNLKERQRFKEYESLERFKDEHTNENHPIWMFFDEHTIFISPNSKNFDDSYETVTKLFLLFKAYSEIYHGGHFAKNPKWFTRSALQLFGNKLKTDRKFINGRLYRVLKGVKVNDIPTELRKHIDDVEFNAS